MSKVALIDLKLIFAAPLSIIINGTCMHWRAKKHSAACGVQLTQKQKRRDTNKQFANVCRLMGTRMVCSFMLKEDTLIIHACLMSVGAADIVL